MKNRLSLAALLLAAPQAAAEWRLEPHEDRGAFAEAREAAGAVTADGLPDGLVARGVADIEAAWYEAPTRRYRHGALGDVVEAGALAVETKSGLRLRVELPEDQVFEDIAPRVVDLDGDGRAEIVTIRADLSAGAAVALYGLRERRLEEIAATAPIGTPNRWLNIAALADLDGDGRAEIAFVRTPHIGGTLRVFGWDGAALILIAEMRGFSNHANGARELGLSAVIAGPDGPALALPDDARRRLRLVALRDGALEDRGGLALPARAEAIRAAGGGALIALEDGTALRLFRE